MQGDRAALVARLRAAGFDAARATSGITAVAEPATRLELVPVTANAFMANVVFVPAYPRLGTSERRRLATLLGSAL